MLKVENLTVRYSAVTAVNGISFEVNEGEAIALLGANGAGKTTALRAISGLVRPASGESKIIFDGREIQAARPEQIFKLGIAQVPEGRHVIPGLSVMDNLLLGGASRADKPTKAELKRDAERVVGIFPGLNKVINRLGWTLSGGEQQMCAIARAMMGKPRILLLDEPSQGLAPVVVQELFAQIKHINESGTTVLLVEQNAHLAMRVCARVYVMQLGTIVYQNPSEIAMHDNTLIDSYLGT